MTWVGYTNTFIVSVANLITAVATIIYVVRNRTVLHKNTQDVSEIKKIVQNGNGNGHSDGIQ
jgi:uncharacterized protein YoxC